MDFDCFKTAKELLSNDLILIVSHRNPDGDTLCSSSALCSALRRAGRTAYLFANPQISEKFSEYTDDYLAPDSFLPKYIVAVDVADVDMVSQGFECMVDLCIDHHKSNPHFAKNNCINFEKSATAEIILEIINLIDGDITPHEADMLYIGLATDNGCFQYGNTNADSHLAAAALIDAGADILNLNNEFFGTFSRARIALQGMIFKGFEFYHDGAVVISSITKAMIIESGATEDDLNNIASLPAKVEGAIIAVTIREINDNYVRVSVRTKGDFNANDICAVFGGGGHPMAAGCSIEASLYHAKSMILEVVDSLWK